MLENLQKTSTTHVGLQPNSQVRCSKIPEFQQHPMVSVMSTVLKLFQKHVFLYFFFLNMASLF